MNKTKRKILIASVALVAAAIVVTALIFAAANKGPFSGTVTDSSTGKPIVDVCVTDGRNVVKTDENGNFKLKGWRKSHFVTVTVPAGYQTDAFYLPVDETKESYDFSLNPSEVTAKEDHCFLQISDTEIGESGAGEWLENLKGIVKENNPAFLIHTGDICYEAGLKKHIEQMNTDTMGCTVRYVIGNHDYVDGDFGEQLYESLYGPVWYSFDVGNVHYVVTSFQTGSDYLSAYGRNDRWKWLKNDLANVDSDKKVILFNHNKSAKDNYVLSFGANKLDLKEHNLIAWVFGHYHYNYISENEGVLNICAPRPDCGGIDSSPAGTRIIRVSKDGAITTNTDYYGSDAFAPPENVLWSTKLQGNVLFCDTVYDDGVVYTATVDDDYPHDCGIYALNAADGEVKWYFKTETSVKNNIVIDGEKLLAMDADGNVYCLDKATGDSLWQPLKVELSEGVGTSSGICADQGVLYAGNARVITAINISDGSIKWSKSRRKGENSPAEFMVVGNKLIVNSHWDALVALDTESGKELWSNKDEDLRFRSSTPVAVDSETLLVADSDAVMIISLNDGNIISKTAFDGYNFSSSGQPVCRDGVAYIPTARQGLIAFDIQNGAVLWRFETGDSILFTAPYVGKDCQTVESSPIIDGDHLIFGANDGYIYTLDRKTGDEIKKDFAGSAVLGKIADEDGKLFAGTFEGYMICDQK
ncbi:MAG: PQQ-binding-like beta-propeller repeat protein [Acutalibacteraceae bacterium]